MKKISILCLHLGFGGIEKSIAALTNLLSDEYEIEIIATYKLYDTPPYEINKKVKIKYLIDDDTALRVDLYKKLFVSFNWFKLFHELFNDYFKGFHFIKLIRDSFMSVKILIDKRRLMIKNIKNNDADIIISTTMSINKWVGKYAHRRQLKIGWEHNHHHGDENYAMQVTKSAWNLDHLVLVSDSLRSFYKKRLKESKCKCIAIPNILDHLPEQLSELKEKSIISVGRLSPEKGYGDLIEVFNLIHKKRPEWKLDIIGDGAQKNLVCDKIYSYGLNNFVNVHGFQKKQVIDELLHVSSIYLMTSYTESFGIVLVEAMSHGIPCIAFNSAEGANTLINEGENGFLIANRDFEKMAEKTIELIDSQSLRVKLGKKGRAGVLQFAPELIKKQWQKLFKG